MAYAVRIANISFLVEILGRQVYFDGRGVVRRESVVESSHYAVQRRLLHDVFAPEKREGLSLVNSARMFHDAPCSKEVPLLRRYGRILEHPETPGRQNLARVPGEFSDVEIGPSFAPQDIVRIDVAPERVGTPQDVSGRVVHRHEIVGLHHFGIALVGPVMRRIPEAPISAVYAEIDIHDMVRVKKSVDIQFNDRHSPCR